MSKNFKLNDSQEDDFVLLTKSLHGHSKSLFKNLSNKAFYRKLLVKRLPFISWICKYEFRSNLLQDFTAGFTIGKTQYNIKIF